MVLRYGGAPLVAESPLCTQREPIETLKVDKAKRDVKVEPPKWQWSSGERECWEE